MLVLSQQEHKDNNNKSAKDLDYIMCGGACGTPLSSPLLPAGQGRFDLHWQKSAEEPRRPARPLQKCGKCMMHIPGQFSHRLGSEVKMREDLAARTCVFARTLSRLSYQLHIV